MEYALEGNIMELYELADEINNMSDEQEIPNVKRVVQAELGKNENIFWSRIAKKILLGEKLTSKIILEVLLLLY